MNTTLKSVLCRFLRGGIAGATGLMAVLIFSGSYNLLEIKEWLLALGMAGIVGFVSGFILAVDKWARIEQK
jgi:hypothetical protein